MIIVDTSVWVDHFRRRGPALARIIADEGVVLHPYVRGELLLGGLSMEGEVAEQLAMLPCPPVASSSEAAAFISWGSLAGTGIGYVDTHLLVSAKLASEGRVLTRDKRLLAQAERLGVAYAP